MRTETTPERAPWVFDQQVTDVFDDMLSRSIPGLSAMRQLTTELAASFVVPGTSVLDLGASRGRGVEPLVRRFGAANRFDLVERSGPMAAALREQFAGYIESGVVRVHETDLETGLPPCKASVVLSVLTLQFVPVDLRTAVLAAARERLVDGGALLIVEKTSAMGPVAGRRLREHYHAFKAASGYSQSEIADKAHRLRFVMSTVPGCVTERFLAGAGFTEIEPYWRHLNFAGWLAIK